MLWRYWKLYLTAILVGLAGYLLLPAGEWPSRLCDALVGWIGAAGVVAGVRRHRPAGAVGWYLIAAGVFLNATGILVEMIQWWAFQLDTPPTVADIFYLGLYPGLVGGLVYLNRARTAGRDWASGVDALTITTGLSLLMWVFLVRPAVGDPELTRLGTFIGVLYPIGDIAILAIIARLLLGGGNRMLSYWLLTGAGTCFLAGDTAWAIINQLGVETTAWDDKLLGLVFLGGFTLFGLAALHPSMREVAQAAPRRRHGLSPALLVVLTAVSLTAPAVLLLEVAHDDVQDGIAISVGSAALFVLVVARMAQLLRQVERQSVRLRELSHVDDLTGLPNRRAWTGELPRAVERARRDGVPLCVAMIDLDYFKRFNDEYGHPAGDRLLKSAGAAWHGMLRTVDQLARYGGEEFIVLLPQADGPAAIAVLDRLREATPLGQTFSAGVACWDGTETSDELIARADAALYQAKRAGRDRVLLAGAALDAA